MSALEYFTKRCARLTRSFGPFFWYTRRGRYIAETMRRVLVDVGDNGTREKFRTTFDLFVIMDGDKAPDMARGLMVDIRYPWEQ